MTSWGIGVKKDAEAVHIALVQLIEKGVLTEVSLTTEERQKLRGAAVRIQKFKKRCICDIRRNPRASGELQRLSVSLDDYFLQEPINPIASRINDIATGAITRSMSSAQPLLRP